MGANGTHDDHPAGWAWPTSPVVARPVPAAPARFLAGSAVVVTVAGTFLPWLISGQVRRNSYAVAGIADRLLVPDDHPLALLVGGWPLLGPALLVPVAVAALRWWRTAALLCLPGTVLAGTVAVWTLTLSGRPGLVAVDPLGPTVTAVGAVGLLVGVVAILGTTRHRDRPAGMSG